MLIVPALIPARPGPSGPTHLSGSRTNSGDPQQNLFSLCERHTSALICPQLQCNLASDSSFALDFGWYILAYLIETSVTSTLPSLSMETVVLVSPLAASIFLPLCHQSLVSHSRDDQPAWNELGVDLRAAVEQSHAILVAPFEWLRPELLAEDLA
jgi:hypothetical protein